MCFVLKKRGVARGLNKKAFIMHEIYMLIAQIIIVFLVTVAMFQYVNSKIDNSDFEQRFTAIDLALITTTIFHAPGTLTHEYTPITYRNPTTINWENSIVSVEERGSIIGGKMYWFLSNKNMEPLSDTYDLAISDIPIEELSSDEDLPSITYYKSGKEITLEEEQNNPLHLTCPAIETEDEDWQSKNIFVGRIMQNAEEFRNMENPTNSITNFLVTRYPNFYQDNDAEITDGNIISAIPSEAEIVFIIGDAGTNKEPGSLTIYTDGENTKSRKLGCFIINDILTPDTSVFYAQVMPVFTEELEDESKLKVFNEKSSEDQVMVFLDISKFQPDQIDTEKITETIHRAINRYYGGYELGRIPGATLSYVEDPNAINARIVTQGGTGTGSDSSVVGTNPPRALTGTGNSPFERMQSVCTTSPVSVEEGLRLLKDITAFWAQETMAGGAVYVRGGMTHSPDGRCTNHGQPDWIKRTLERYLDNYQAPETCSENLRNTECIEALRRDYNTEMVSTFNGRYVCGDCGTFLQQLYKCAFGRIPRFKTNPINAPIIATTQGAISSYNDYHAIWNEHTVNGRRTWGEPENCWEMIQNIPGGIQFGDIIEFPGHWVMWTGGAGLNFDIFEMGGWGSFDPAGRTQRAQNPQFNGERLGGVRTTQNGQVALSGPRMNQGCAIRRVSSEPARYEGYE